MKQFKDFFEGLTGTPLSGEALQQIAKRLENGEDVHIHIPVEGLGNLTEGLNGLQNITQEMLKGLSQQHSTATPSIADVLKQIREGNPIPSGILVQTENGIEPLTPELMKEILHKSMNGETFNVKPNKPEAPKTTASEKETTHFTKTPPAEFTYDKSATEVEVKIETTQPTGDEDVHFTKTPPAEFAQFSTAGLTGSGKTIATTQQKKGVIPFTMASIEENLEKAKSQVSFWEGMKAKKQQEIDNHSQKRTLIAEFNAVHQEITDLEKILLEFSDNLGLLLVNNPEAAGTHMARIQQISAEIVEKKALAEELRSKLERVQ